MTIILPPKGSSELSVKSLKILSTASKVYLCAISASSQMINLAILIKSANSLFLLIFKVDVSIIGMEILNLEWAVLPPFNNNAAIPDEATAIAI